MEEQALKISGQSYNQSLMQTLREERKKERYTNVSLDQYLR
jgi:uncharacterized protein YbgA (DUF1722 family)